MPSPKELARLKSIRLGKRKVEEEGTTVQKDSESAVLLFRQDPPLQMSVSEVEDISMIDDMAKHKDDFTPESIPERHVWQVSELTTFSNLMELIARLH
jgi:hypothetical protein